MMNKDRESECAEMISIKLRFFLNVEIEVRFNKIKVSYA